MARYIDADAFLEKMKQTPRYFDVKFDVENFSAADVEEVKHGYNQTSMHPVDEFLCSECGFCCADYTETKYDEDGEYSYSCECEFHYCPKCGAKMDGGKAE